MEYNLYNGTVTLHFNEEKHLYTLNGQKVDGVTSILGIIAKPALLFWAVNKSIDYMTQNIRPGVSYDEIQLGKLLKEAKTAHSRHSAEASDIGSFVHKWIEDYLLGKKPKMPVNTQIRNSVEQFLSWEKAKKVKFLLSERVLYSKQFNYAGTCDFICEMDGKIFLGDFKSSKEIYPEYFFQTSAYQLAYLEEFPDKKVEGQIIVRLGKDGSLEIKEDYEYEKNIKAFLGARDLYKRVQELKDKAYEDSKRVSA